MAFEGISEDDIKAWRDAFPNVNIDKELKACQLWAGTVHRANYRKSINSWMANVSKANGSASGAGNVAYTEIQVTGTKEDEKINKEYAKKLEDKFSQNRAVELVMFAHHQKRFHLSFQTVEAMMLATILP